MDEGTHRTCVNTIKGLAMDAVQQANSGHPGMPMGAADMAEAWPAVAGSGSGITAACTLAVFFVALLGRFWAFLDRSWSVLGRSCDLSGRALGPF